MEEFIKEITELQKERKVHNIKQQTLEGHSCIYDLADVIIISL